MRRRFRVTAVLVTLAAGTIAAPAAVGHAATTPTVHVSPHARLIDGQTVQLTATGITPGATVEINECQDHFFNPDADCPDLTTATADTAGDVSTPVTVKALVYRNIEFGDPIPEYCREDTCHLFVIWTDASSQDQLADSGPLQFQGAEAHIHVHPSTDIHRIQKVAVNGSAYGAFGQTVQIVQEGCFQMVQGSGCYGARTPKSTIVKPDGSWSVNYNVRRFMPVGDDTKTDCADTYDLLGQCVINVTVLGTDGQPDPTYGDSRVGDPNVVLSFHAHPPRQVN